MASNSTQAAAAVFEPGEGVLVKAIAEPGLTMPVSQAPRRSLFRVVCMQQGLGTASDPAKAR